jgi:hypothetical protein
MPRKDAARTHDASEAAAPGKNARASARMGGTWWNGDLPSREAAVFVLLLSRGIGAAYAPISDCDEVFNYWEPLHFSIYGTGAQTWEYSPKFALRSWLYVLLHSLNALVFRIFYAEPVSKYFHNFGAPPPKVLVFYLVRFSLVAASAVADAALYRCAGERDAECFCVSAVLPSLCTTQTHLPLTMSMSLARSLARALSQCGSRASVTSRTTAGARSSCTVSAMCIVRISGQQLRLAAVHVCATSMSGF